MKFKKTIATLQLANNFLDKIGFNSEEFKESIQDSLNELEKANNSISSNESTSEKIQKKLQKAFVDGYKARAEASGLAFNEKRESHANILFGIWKSSN